MKAFISTTTLPKALRPPLSKCPLRTHPSARPKCAPLLRMNLQPPPSPNQPPEQPSSAPPAHPVEEDAFTNEETFVMEDELPLAEPDEEYRIIWNKIPTPSALFERSFLADLLIVLTIVAIVYGLVLTTGRLFSSLPYSLLTIDTSLNVLPWYAAQSVTRMIVGYAVSIVFSLGYAYMAYKVKFAAKILMLVIDVLQSIPLLSFLPGVVLSLIAIFPGERIGVELAAVLLLFTSMAWNMLLGFYQSLCCIPNDLLDVAETFRLSPWKRFWTLELPAGAIGLVWNSVISVAGGWFFLISIESFELGNRDFKLPGLGSYLAAAADSANYSAIFSGLLVVIAIIVVIDFLIWRPLISWSSKFTYGGSSGEDNRSRSVVLNALQRSPLVRSIHASFIAPMWEKFVNISFSPPVSGENGYVGSETQNGMDRRERGGKISGKSLRNESNSSAGWPPLDKLLSVMKGVAKKMSPIISNSLPPILYTLLLIGVGYGVYKAFHMVELITVDKWVAIGTAALATFARVCAALGLSLLWTVPAGVAIGRNAKLAAAVQPIVQVAASVPATALFPFVLLFLTRLGGGLEVGSVALMMLGTMWYVLFNVIAGAQAIPDELFEVDAIYNKEGRWKRWQTLVMPGIFPYLITGVVTAVGGAWNASIVSEYVVFRGGVMKTHGLGSLISEAAASGDYALLLAGTVVMSLLVLLTNRLVWDPLYRLAESKYRI